MSKIADSSFTDLKRAAIATIGSNKSNIGKNESFARTRSERNIRRANIFTPFDVKFEYLNDIYQAYSLLIENSIKRGKNDISALKPIGHSIYFHFISNEATQQVLLLYDCMYILYNLDVCLFEWYRLTYQVLNPTA